LPFPPLLGQLRRYRTFSSRQIFSQLAMCILSGLHFKPTDCFFLFPSLVALILLVIPFRYPCFSFFFFFREDLLHLGSGADLDFKLHTLPNPTAASSPFPSGLDRAGKFVLRQGGGSGVDTGRFVYLFPLFECGYAHRLCHPSPVCPNSLGFGSTKGYYLPGKSDFLSPPQIVTWCFILFSRQVVSSHSALVEWVYRRRPLVLSLPRHSTQSA